ncbi:hypothetical protein K4H03_21085, partial [Mycobacterium tuberculosis]|nr:hypothetical protein [Mycobacterium tuberculosis]
MRRLRLPLDPDLRELEDLDFDRAVGEARAEPIGKVDMLDADHREFVEVAGVGWTAFPRLGANSEAKEHLVAADLEHRRHGVGPARIQRDLS